MRDRLCAKLRMEVVLPSGARLDCLAPNFAIEIDWTEKWAESIGQALDYAAETGLKPGIILICRDAKHLCIGRLDRLLETRRDWRLPITVWYCDIRSPSLQTCLFIAPPDLLL